MSKQMFLFLFNYSNNLIPQKQLPDSAALMHPFHAFGTFHQERYITRKYQQQKQQHSRSEAEAHFKQHQMLQLGRHIARSNSSTFSSRQINNTRNIIMQVLTKNDQKMNDAEYHKNDLSLAQINTSSIHTSFYYSCIVHIHCKQHLPDGPDRTISIHRRNQMSL